MEVTARSAGLGETLVTTIELEGIEIMHLQTALYRSGFLFDNSESVRNHVNALYWKIANVTGVLAPEHVAKRNPK